ncbi:MAG: aldo/keto reductase [Propionibacteriaceae bacterium]|jgi:2,5-diketo-D-gluconate reductase A|nr:aldo/keto reductase [Propionibacteriaceae bacterium]
MSVPFLTLNQGNTIPQLGFGTFKIDPELTQGIVEEALAAGFRHIDTATVYGNEAEVGAAIRASGIPREDLFVTTKLWNDAQKSDQVRAAYERSLGALGIDYVDLYLIHWPMPALDKYVGAWNQLIQFKSEGLTKSIGVSNFKVPHLQRIIEETGVVPAVNQVELHPLFQQVELRKFHDDHDITTEAWAPLGQGKYSMADYPAITAAAIAHEKTPTQVALRWHIQTGNVVIPKASSRAHMDEDFNIFDFELTPAEMTAINALDTNQRQSIDPDDFNE